MCGKQFRYVEIMLDFFSDWHHKSRMCRPSRPALMTEGHDPGHDFRCISAENDPASAMLAGHFFGAWFVQIYLREREVRIVIGNDDDLHAPFRRIGQRLSQLGSVLRPKL